MKALLTTLALTVIAQAASADMYCGVTTETVPGSQIYYKSLFYTKVDPTSSLYQVVLPDGRVAQPLPTDTIPEGSMVFGASFLGNGSLWMARAKKDSNGRTVFKDRTVAGGDSRNMVLMRDGYSFTCKEVSASHPSAEKKPRLNP